MLNRNKNMEEQLIEFIRKNKFLFDKRHKNYKNSRLREQKYEELAAKLNVPPRKLKDRWRTLKDKFYKEAKMQTSQRKWKWMDHLSFLNVNIENSKIGKFEKIVPEVYIDTRHESFSEFLKEDSTSFSSTTYNLLNTPSASAPPKKGTDEMMLDDAKTEFNETAQLAIEVLREPKKSVPKKSSIQLFCESLASQIDEANLSQYKFSGLQIALLKTFQDFIHK